MSAPVTRTVTTVAVTAGGGRAVHLGRLAQDSDRERAYRVNALCGADSGRPGSVTAWFVVPGPVTCGKCARRPEQLGNSSTWTR